MIHFRPVALHDSEALQLLMESNADYTMRIQGSAVAKDAASQALTALPSNTMRQQKIGFGLWEAGKLLAYADIIQGWPESDSAHIGLLMTDRSRRGEGLGRRLHKHVVHEFGKEQRFVWLRISIVDTNAEFAEPFWIALGYEPTNNVVPISMERSQLIHEFGVADLVKNNADAHC